MLVVIRLLFIVNVISKEMLWKLMLRKIVLNGLLNLFVFLEESKLKYMIYANLKDKLLDFKKLSLV